MPARPDVEEHEDHEGDPALDDLMGPGAGNAMKRDGEKSPLETSSVYTPLPSLPTASVTFHVPPAGSAGISILYRPGPLLAGSSVAAMGSCCAGPANVAVTFFPCTGSPFESMSTTLIVIGALACGVAGSANPIML